MHESVWAVLPTPVANHQSIEEFIKPHLRSVKRSAPVIDSFTREDIDVLRKSAEDRGWEYLDDASDAQIISEVHYGAEYFNDFRPVDEDGNVDEDGVWRLKVQRGQDFYPDNPWDSVSLRPELTLIDNRNVMIVDDFLTLLPFERERAYRIASLEYDRMEEFTSGVDLGDEFSVFLDREPERNGLHAFYEYAKTPWPKAAASSRGASPDPIVGCEHQRYFIGRGGRNEYTARAMAKVVNPSSLVLADGTLLQKKSCGEVPEWSEFVMAHLAAQDRSHLIVVLDGFEAN